MTAAISSSVISWRPRRRPPPPLRRPPRLPLPRCPPILLRRPVRRPRSCLLLDARRRILGVALIFLDDLLVEIGLISYHVLHLLIVLSVYKIVGDDLHKLSEGFVTCVVITPINFPNKIDQTCYRNFELKILPFGKF